MTSGTETCSHLDESKIRPRTVKVRTPADQNWHVAKGTLRPRAETNHRLGRIPGRPDTKIACSRPTRIQ